MDKIKLGDQPEDHHGRDAIHIAVMPVTAAHDMKPGAHVGLDASGNASEHATPLIGIIDPFFGMGLLHLTKQMGITHLVRGSGRYWLLLYPNTITSLRHEWSHPVVDSLAPQKSGGSPDADASIRWMEDYVAQVCPYYIEEYNGVTHTKHEAYLLFMQRVAEGEIFYSGSDLHSSGDVEDREELFQHLSVILGRKVGVDDFSYSCSC